MSILFVLIPLSLLLVALAGWGFFWAVDSGQFDDLDSPSWDMLRDEPAASSATSEQSAERSSRHYS